MQVYDKGDRAIVTGNTITGAGHSGIVVGGSGGVSGVRVHNNVLAFNAHYGHLPRLHPARRARSPTTTSPSATAAARPSPAARASSFAGGNRRPEPALRRLREPQHAPRRRQPRDRLRARRLLADDRPRRQRPHVRLRARGRRVRVHGRSDTAAATAATSTAASTASSAATTATTAATAAAPTTAAGRRARRC